MKKMLAGVFVLFLLLPTQAFANENFKDLELPAGQIDKSTLPYNFQQKLDKRTKEVNDYLVKLDELKAQVEQAEKSLLKGIAMENSLTRFNEASAELEYFENNSFEIAGLNKVEIGNQTSLIQPLSHNGQATVKAPTLYYDNDVASYVLSSGWNWSAINPDRNNSGEDGFGLRVNQEKISLISDHLTTWNYGGTKYFPSYTTKASPYGYYQLFPDAGVGSKYSAHRGTSWMFFRFYNGAPLGKTVNFSGQYAHTYESTNLTGISIGATSFGGSFSVKNKGWKVDNYSFKKF